MNNVYDGQSLNSLTENKLGGPILVIGGSSENGLSCCKYVKMGAYGFSEN